MARRWLVLLHRWVGLVMAGFLVIAGLTGAVLVWYHELDAALNPQLLRVAPPAASSHGPPRPLDPLLLRERVQAAYPQAWAHWVPLRAPRPDAALVFWIEGAADAEGVHAELPVDEVFVDPYTGTVLGGRRWGDLGQGLQLNLMPFVYRLHESLALGTVGTWIFGIVALLWTLDCFVGAWLTFPRRQHLDSGSWWARWSTAWRVRWRAGSWKLNFDLHRAGGLWPWALLFVLAWSSVAFNLYEPVYKPVMGMLFELRPDPRAGIPKLARDEPEPAMGWDAGLQAARAHLKQVATERGLRIAYEERLSYDPHRGIFRLLVRSDLDINQTRSQTTLLVDARSGALRGMWLPSGQAAGDTLTAWLTTLHMAHIWGLPFRVLITVSGLLIVLISVTGVVIWWRKRSARFSAARLRSEFRL